MENVYMEEKKYIGKGLYTIKDAMALTGISYAKVRHWIRGDLRTDEFMREGVPPVINSEFGKIDSKYILSFHDLIEVIVINSLEKYGVSLKNIRSAHFNAQKLYNTKHPFSLKRYWTDGKWVLTDGPDRDNELINLINNQHEIREVVNPFLAKVEYDNRNEIPLRLWPMGTDRNVVIDPNRSFGQPIVKNEGVPTYFLASSVIAEGSIRKTALWYGVDESSVHDAFEYEKNILKRIAA